MQSDNRERDAEVWSAVCEVARFVSRESSLLGNPSAMIAELSNCGYSSDTISEALAWLDKAAVSGHLFEALSMLQPRRGRLRFGHPLEHALIPSTLLHRIELCRNAGLIGDELVEQIIEALRRIDMRDLEDHQVVMLVDDLVTQSIPGQNISNLHQYLRGQFVNKLN